MRRRPPRSPLSPSTTLFPSISVPATDFTVAAWFRWTTNPSPYYSGIQGGGLSWELRVMADGRFGATFYQSIGPDVFTEIVRSEERRVGKECRSRWSPYH